TVSSCRRSSHPRRLIVKDNRNSIRKEVLHLIKFVKKTVAIPKYWKKVELKTIVKDYKLLGVNLHDVRKIKEEVIR
ncbi:hypothetical protein ACFDAZ_13530, partial [Enterococcus lactis]